MQHAASQSAGNGDIGEGHMSGTMGFRLGSSVPILVFMMRTLQM
jgi:hypothetical protein